MMFLLAACFDHHADKGSDGESGALDSGDLDTGDTDTGGSDSGDTGDTGAYEPLPLSDGFEVGLQRWSLWFSGEWGGNTFLQGVNADGDVGLLTSLHPGADWQVGTSYTMEFADESVLTTAYGIIVQGPGVDCLIDECVCDVVGTYTYRIASGQVDVSVWRHTVDIRISDLVLRPQFEGEDLVVPLIEYTGVPIRICPWLCD